MARAHAPDEFAHRGISPSASPTLPGAVEGDQWAANSGAGDDGSGDGAAVAPPTETPRAQERRLREDYATSSDVVGPALRLAAWLADRERHAEALFVLEQARMRSDEVALRLAHAGLLRDTGRNEAAARELQAVCRDRQRYAVAPGTLLELAQVELLAGQRDQARRTYAELLQVVGDGSWFTTHGEELARLRVAIEQPGGGASYVSMRDLLAMLRSSPSATVRVELIDRLMAPVPVNDAALADERAALRARVLAIGCGDDSPAVRARTVRAAGGGECRETAFWRAALADDAALVRLVAAGAAVEALDRQASALLLERLECEADVEVFVALHRALERVHGAAGEFRLAVEHEPGREAARAWWRTRSRR